MPRDTRYQGAIIRDHHILLLRQTEHASGRSYWQIPGGGIEPGESEEMCVQREMHEETCLRVQVQRLLLDEPSTPGAIYRRWKTYVCHILEGEAQPGCEPEAAYAEAYSFTDVGWFDLRRPASWDDQIVSSPYLFSLLQRIRAALGYAEAARPHQTKSG
jgi:8-oxo-dGTP diphosphatase